MIADSQILPNSGAVPPSEMAAVAPVRQSMRLRQRPVYDRGTIGLWIASAALAVVVLASMAVVAGGWIGQVPMAYLAVTTAIPFVFAMILMLRRGWYATAIFLLFVLQPLQIVYVDHIWGDENPLWPLLFPNAMMTQTMALLFVHAQFMLLCVLVAAAIYRPHPQTALNRPTMNAIGVIFAWAVCGTLTLLVLATALTTTRGDYTMDVQGGDRFVMVIGPLFIGMGAGLGLIFRNYAMKLLGVFCLFAALLSAFSGYRSVFVFAVVAATTAILGFRRLSWSLLLLGGVGMVVAYDLMSYLAYIRSLNVSLGDIIAGTAPAPDWNQVAGKAGYAEQIAVFTVEYANRVDPYYGLTYLYALLRALPNALYTMIAIPPRIQDILVDAGPIAFKRVGLNLGAYFFAESILNFGAVMAGGVTAFVITVLAWVENGRMRTVYRQMVYPAVVMLMPALALYGSANVIKQMLAIMAFLFLLNLIGVSRGSSQDASVAAAPKRRAVA